MSSINEKSEQWGLLVSSIIDARAAFYQPGEVMTKIENAKVLEHIRYRIGQMPCHTPIMVPKRLKAALVDMDQEKLNAALARIVNEAAEELEAEEEVKAFANGIRLTLHGVEESLDAAQREITEETVDFTALRVHILAVGERARACATQITAAKDEGIIDYTIA